MVCHNFCCKVVTPKTTADRLGPQNAVNYGVLWTYHAFYLQNKWPPPPPAKADCVSASGKTRPFAPTVRADFGRILLLSPLLTGYIFGDIINGDEALLVGVFRSYEINLDVGWAEVRLWLSAAWHHFFQEVKAAWMIGAETPIFTKNEPRCFGHWSPPELESWKIWYICHGGNMWYLLRYLTLLRIFYCFLWCLRLVFVASIYSGILVWIADRLGLNGFSLQTPLRQFEIGQANTIPISKHWSSICQWPSSTCFVHWGLLRCRETCMWKLESCLRKCWAVMLGVVTGNMVAMMLACLWPKL